VALSASKSVWYVGVPWLRLRQKTAAWHLNVMASVTGQLQVDARDRPSIA